MLPATWSVLVIEDSEIDQEIVADLLTEKSACTCVFAERLSRAVGRRCRATWQEYI